MRWSASLLAWWQERDERKEREKLEFLRSVVGLWPPDTIETLARHMTHLTVDALTVRPRPFKYSNIHIIRRGRKLTRGQGV